MSDHAKWLQDQGYSDDEVEGAVVLHRDLDSGARVSVRQDAEQWCVASFAKRADESTVSFVMSGLTGDQLKAKLAQCEAELSWLYEQFTGR